MHSDIGFKIVVIVAVIAVLSLLGSAGYYLYTAGNVAKKSPATTYTPPTTAPSVANTAGVGSPVSSSDKTATIGRELNQTTVEDFGSDFTTLQKDSAGL